VKAKAPVPSVFAKVKKAILRDWEYKKGEVPSNPEEFQSMYTSDEGDRWWCRTENDATGRPQLLVWGDGLDMAMTKTGSKAKAFPWFMDEGERSWLLVNLDRLGRSG